MKASPPFDKILGWICYHFMEADMKKLLEQIIKFGIVGVICFVIDFTITTIPTYFFGQNTVYILHCQLSAEY